MIRCGNCVMVSTRPDHVFVNGLCPACVNKQESKPRIDWDSRYKELEQLLDRYHGEVLVPSSGQKDSTYQAVTLKKMGAHVTAITARTCHLSDIGRKNIDNLARHVKTIEVTPNQTVRSKLNRMGLEVVGDISLPEHMAIFTTPFRMAVDLKSPLIMYGENSQLEYGGPVGTENTNQLTSRWRSELGGFCGMRPSDFIGMEGITKKDMEDYEIPSSEVIKEARVEAHFLGYYLPWDSHQNAETAKKHGMIQEKPCNANWWDFENLDNIQTGVHDYFMYLKYGYGRGCSQISVDVRNGLISRGKALDWIEKYDGYFPSEYMGVPIEDMLDRIDLNLAKFMEIANEFSA